MDDQEFINQLAEKLSKLGTVRPLGFHYLHPYGTVPADSIICNGATYSRALYKDFFDYITTQGWVKTEAEWQEIATRDNGFCPFYSSGDGSTNFRVPRFAPSQVRPLVSSITEVTAVVSLVVSLVTTIRLPSLLFRLRTTPTRMPKKSICSL